MRDKHGNEYDIQSRFARLPSTKSDTSIFKYYFLIFLTKRMTELKKLELEELRGWFKYFNELVEKIDCVECIKVNKNKSTETRKRFDLYCVNCFLYRIACYGKNVKKNHGKN